MIGSNAVRWAKYWPAYGVHRLSSAREQVCEDLRRWIAFDEPGQPTEAEAFIQIFATRKEFRTLFFRRQEAADRMLRERSVSTLMRRVYRPLAGLHLNTPTLGNSFFILHGDSSHILAARIGDDCLVCQQVTIGTNFGTGTPRIGNNVMIMAGAKVLGGIEVGDNVVVGANAVVTRDVPPNCVVAGVPARIIKRDGKRVDERL